MKRIKKIIEAHKFFCRKSQHYVLGNWNEYEEWVKFVPNVGYRFNKAKLLYYRRFPLAYCKFMFWTIKDLVS